MAKFGFGQIANKSPRWAVNLFRVYFFTSKAFIGWGTATDMIEKSTMVNVTLFITLLADPILFGFSKMFGITQEDIQIQKQDDAISKT